MSTVKILLIEDHVGDGVDVILDDKIIGSVQSGEGWVSQTSNQLYEIFTKMIKMGYLENTEVEIRPWVK